MPIEFLQAQKKQRYLILILTFIICAILLVVWLGFFKTPAPVVNVSSPMTVHPKIEINFGLLKRDLTVVPPVFSAELTANPSLPALNQKIDLAVSQSKKDEAVTLLKKAFSIIDKAKKRDIIHANNAARKKSRLRQKII